MLTSAHVAGPIGSRLEVFYPGGSGVAGGTVVWWGTPGGRDDAALVLADDDPHWQAPKVPVRWGRLVTDRPGTGSKTWGLPDVAQREGRPVEAAQLRGVLNPGSGFVGNQYVVDLLQHPPQWSPEGTSPWGGMSGAEVFADRLLVGVVASDRAYSGGGQLNVVPAYVLHHDPAFRTALAEHGASADHGLEAVELQHPADPAQGRPKREAALAGCSAGGPAPYRALSRPRGPSRRAEGIVRTGRVRSLAAVWTGRAGQDPPRPPPRRPTDRRPVGRSMTEGERHPGAARPLLVVLDYAETRTDQLAALAEAAADHAGTTPLKLLLLARTGGDWWRQAATATRLADDHLATAPRQSSLRSRSRRRWHPRNPTRPQPGPAMRTYAGPARAGVLPTGCTTSHCSRPEIAGEASADRARARAPLAD
ncbi:hypothetical protein Snoj_28910 [Streptomyces nojiriensis]|uniref:Serine protease n=1 Tax=Streptomyces nojiriensis TaxID=66374 RepID=A0ABQ3SLG0_9ACTN|nr:hypothetical protein GCM10010205_79570 [Streptomyces nojiriensis]GHI68973.1 hypothetical protein Snoj_28910 [Streptomyces nojiriensis]